MTRDYSYLPEAIKLRAAQLVFHFGLKLLWVAFIMGVKDMLRSIVKPFLKKLQEDSVPGDVAVPRCVIDKIEEFKRLVPKSQALHFPDTANHKNLLKLIKILDGAVALIDICIFVFTCPELGPAALAAARRGIAVRVICDFSQINQTGSQIRPFVAASAVPNMNIEVRAIVQSTSMHNRFAVVDGKTKLNGSFNWSERARTGEENVEIRTNDDLTESFEASFERMILSKRLLTLQDFYLVVVDDEAERVNKRKRFNS